MSNTVLKNLLGELPKNAYILDAGGWLNPLLAATHVIDLMPYETRRGRLELLPLPGEVFNKSTWHQTNFLDSGLRLPFEDKFFNFVVCTQTIEDLVDPQPLLRELHRVGRAGYFEFPSRIAEQTTGIRDRITSRQGHPHHHWIIDISDGLLEFSPKSLLADIPLSQHAIPLSVYEQRAKFDQTVSNSCFCWASRFSYTIVPEEEARNRAQRLCESLHVTRIERIKDILIRNLRDIKWRVFLNKHDNPSEWWREMLNLSSPYSSIPLT